jgi:hypothetical protein
MPVLTYKQVYDLAVGAGLNSSQAVIATAISAAESGHNPNNIGDQTLAHYGSRGLWQVFTKVWPPNSIGLSGSSWTDANIGQLSDPKNNAHAMYVISNHGTTWQLWSTYNDGSYKQYLSLAQAAAAAPAPTPTPTPPGGTVLKTNKDWARLKGNKNPKAIQAIKNAQQESAHPTHNYKGLCLVFVRTCFGLAADGREPDATSSWSDAGKAQQHTYYNAPAGVPVVWSGGGSGQGHIAIADGHGNVLTTDFGPQGYIGDGHVRLVPLASIVQHDPALHYLGWISQLEGASVYTQG